MILNFVNQVTIGGKTYTLLRDDEDPSQTFVQCGEQTVPFETNDWADHQKITDSFNGV